MVSPVYFSGAMQLGGLTQTASAFNSVQGALSFFINVYRQFAEWRAVIARLAGFEEAIGAARAIGVTSPAIKLTPASHSKPPELPPRCPRRLPPGRRIRKVNPVWVWRMPPASHFPVL